MQIAQNESPEEIAKKLGISPYNIPDNYQQFWLAGAKERLLGASMTSTRYGALIVGTRTHEDPRNSHWVSGWVSCHSVIERMGLMEVMEIISRK